ncbi:methyltransferase [Nonlabens mediterrranea]|uniref:tRNA1(Val) (adenine(37)-N6)-methyltransferase n=1 Tax=Nonlabens mediterrranea TaxID=1419947 RepID=A0ABS0A2Y8_9FLAO|nr:methyltransferase [Nonlabens mediterrranea]
MSIFKFKEFEVAQDRCAQKIGTDGVLLGAWASQDKNPYSILDIGTGTGVISLMLAQRFHSAQIEAIELDEDAYEQAANNFENAAWSDRMFCFHASFQEFFEEVEDTYDLIISNPPFFDSSSIKNDSSIERNREQARFDDALPFEELLYGVYKLLDDDGIFSCIIPYDRENHFLKIAAHYKLFPSRITHVKGTDSSPIKRSLLELRFRESDIQHKVITIEISRHKYTEDYINLVKDFYLKM